MNEITQVQGLRNPSLTLYAFHLRSSISEGIEKTVQEADRLWEQIVDLGQTLHIPELPNLRRKLICYQGNQYSPAAEDRQEPDQLTLLRHGEESLDFRVISHEGGTKLNGFLCPFRLHDSYAVDLTLSEAILRKSLPEESTTWPTSAVVLNAFDVLIHVGIGLLAGLGAALLVLLWKQRRL